MSMRNSFDHGIFRIGQHSLTIDLNRTKEYYATLPKISDNCSCGNCKFFEENVIKRPFRLFEILTEMQVDLARQPNINPDGVSCVGEIDKDQLGYIGYYFVYGKFGKPDAEVGIEAVKFTNEEFGKQAEVTIGKVDSEKLSVEFFIKVDRA